MKYSHCKTDLILRGGGRESHLNATGTGGMLVGKYN